jgi:transposase
MSGSTTQGELFAADDAPPQLSTIVINARCSVRTFEGRRVVSVGGMPVAHYEVGDVASEAHAMVTLVEEAWADQVEVARAFDCSARTVRRMQRRAEHGGIAALVRSAGYPKGRPRLGIRRRQRVHRLKSEGTSNRAIAALLGVSEKAVRNFLRRSGWKPSLAMQPELPLAGADPNLSDSRTPSSMLAFALAENVASAPSLVPDPVAPCADPNLSAPPTAPSAASVDPPASPAPSPDPTPAGADSNLSADADEEPLEVSLDRDPADRRFDRILAFLGMISDAAPLFRNGTRVPRAGVLLALPALIDSGVFDSARKVYGSIGPAFYGLRTTVVAMLLMALLRIKRPEALKEHAPDDLGRLLGLDRAPEVKTLRRKLSNLAAFGRATEFGRALAERRVAALGNPLGFLYVDGHVRVYHGERTIPKAHVARMRIAMPGTTDYWVNDARGDPLFVVTTEANAGLVKILPPLLTEVRRLVGERRITIVFDRGGWSPKLFKKILAANFDVLTYRKGRTPRVARSKFHERVATIDGHKVEYTLADQRIRLLGGKLTMRQVTRLSDNGHQTPIVTSRTDLADIEIAFHMFERWRQENFFKYLREEYALDVLVDYRVEPADPTREVPNPKWNALDAELHRARAVANKLSAVYGIDALDDTDNLCVTLSGFKSAHEPHVRELTAALKRCTKLEARRAKVPRRVPVQQAVDGAIIKLATERKHLTNLIKLVAYQAESDLVRAVAPHYKRAEDEGRTLVQTALGSAADIEVTATELRVTLAPLSSAHRTRAVAALCDELNRADARFPGTKLRLRFGIHLPTADTAA